MRGVPKGNQNSEKVRTEDFSTPRRNLRLRVGLRTSLITCALFTVLVTAAAVHLPWLFASRANTSDMANQLSSEIVAGVSREITDIFSSAVAAQITLRRMMQEGVLDVENDAAREQAFLAFLLANRHFSWVSFGKPNGDFFGARRRDDINYRLVRSKWDAVASLARRRMQYLVQDGTELRPTVIKNRTNSYNAQKRQWYIRAVAQPGTNIWTSVYIFASSRKPGLNTAITFRRNGKLAGVVSIAIELERISRYLAGIKSVRTGAAFIIDKAGRLVAFKDQTDVTRFSKTDKRVLERVPLAEARHPMLRVASAALSDSKGALTLRAGRQVFEDSNSGRRYFVHLISIKDRDWLIGTVIPESDFTSAIEENYTKLILTVSAALLLIGLMAVWASRRFFVKPLHQITEQTRLISEFELDDVRYYPSHIVEIDLLSSAIKRMSHGLGSFRKYLPATLVQTLLHQGQSAEPNAQRRTMTILFMDLEGFTAKSEELGHRIAPMLSDYLGIMSKIIYEHGGTIDKYIGDAIMAFWGAPHHNDQHAEDACRAALACRLAMKKLRQDWETQGKPDMGLRIGINSGRVLVGNIGSTERLNYTVIGDPVNLASRFEGANKVFGTEIIIGQQTWELVRYDVLSRKLDDFQVPGREVPVAIYELLDLREESVGLPPEYSWIEEFEQGLVSFDNEDIEDAKVRFRRVLEMRGEDQPSLYYLKMVEAPVGERASAESKLRGVVPSQSGATGSVDDTSTADD